MEWFKKHTDTIAILSAFGAAILWMNSQFNGMGNRFSEIEKDLAVIKTVLVMKNIMPTELAKCHEKEEKQSTKGE